MRVRVRTRYGKWCQNVLIIVVLFSLLVMFCVRAIFNANDLRQTFKRKAVFHFLKQKSCDAILLQEKRSTSADENLWKYEWGGSSLFSHGNSRSNGVAILFHHKFKFELCSEHSDSDGRILLTKIKLKKNNFFSHMFMHQPKTSQFFSMAYFQPFPIFSTLDYILAWYWNVVLC